MASMRTLLSIAPNLKLPKEAVTETFAILGKRGAGKTTTARVLTKGCWRSAFRSWCLIQPVFGGACAHPPMAPATVTRYSSSAAITRVYRSGRPAAPWSPMSL